MVDEKSNSDVYEQVAERMSNWIVRSPISKELRKILKSLFSPEEAKILLVFNGPFMDRLTAEKIARKLKRPVEEVKPILDEMARTQRLFSVERNNKRTYSMFPLVPGLFELFFANHKRAEAEERELVKLFAEEFEKYYNKGYAAEFASSTMPFMRVFVDQKVVDNTIKKGKGKTVDLDIEITDALKHHIMPFEQVKNLIEQSRKVAVMDCACRVHMRIHNDGVPVNDYPVNVCMSFNIWADYVVEQGFGKELSTQEALETLSKAAKAGLVHTTQNITEKITFICNCDRDCCILLRGLTKFRNPNSVATSNFLPEYEKESCIFCEKCVDICPMYAIQHHYGHKKDKSDETIMINNELCIGCGVCAFNCPKGAIIMVKKYEKVPAEKPAEQAQAMVEGRIH
ncbi:MAG: 4Fe-4S binding protein [Candidatus Helarchaeota archaeon]|nr:4Fe-4S binding protein [Candidatus Helarchaeota archaeon]